MSKLIVSEFVSLNGVMEAPGGEQTHPHTGWTFKSTTATTTTPTRRRRSRRPRSLLLGRKTYEGFAAAWPTARPSDPFTDKINSMPKYVVSSTLTDPEWENTTVLSGDPIERSRSYATRSTGRSSSTARRSSSTRSARPTSSTSGERWSTPTLIADGLRMFPTRATCRSSSSPTRRTYDSGVALLIYTRAEDCARAQRGRAS